MTTRDGIITDVSCLGSVDSLSLHPGVTDVSALGSVDSLSLCAGITDVGALGGVLEKFVVNCTATTLAVGLASMVLFGKCKQYRTVWHRAVVQ
jgi:hypothetical protein